VVCKTASASSVIYAWFPSLYVNDCATQRTASVFRSTKTSRKKSVAHELTYGKQLVPRCNFPQVHGIVGDMRPPKFHPNCPIGRRVIAFPKSSGGVPAELRCGALQNSYVMMETRL